MYCLKQSQFLVKRNRTWKALRPSTRSRPEDTTYGKNTYFGYSGRHQVYFNFLRPSLHPHLFKLPPRFLHPPQQKSFVTFLKFFVSKICFTNLLFHKENFRKYVSTSLSLLTFCNIICISAIFLPLFLASTKVSIVTTAKIFFNFF